MSSPDELPPAVSPSRPGLLRDHLVQKLERRIDDEQATGRLPSLVVGLVRDGSLLWWGGRGPTGAKDGSPATSTTQYRVGSITKTFVAATVLRLRDEGALGLNDAVGQHLPELAGLPITIGHLLSHTSGLRAEPPGPWWERAPGTNFNDLASSIGRPNDLLWRPGRRFHYSNLGYAVLGELLARKREAPFGEVLRHELFEPLGMRRTSLRPAAPHAQGLAVHPHADLVFREPEHDSMAMAPAGQLWSTVEDLARWSEVLVGRRPEILKEESVAEMAEPVALVNVPGQPWTGAYGLGLQLWNQGGSRRYGHTGGMPGFWAILLVDQASKDVVVSVANSTYAGLRPAFFDEVLSLLISEQPRPPTPFQTSRLGADQGVLEVLGTWYWGPVEYRMNLRADGHLELRGVPSGRECSFRPGHDGTYVGESGYFDGEQMVLCRRDDGALSHLDVASFVFTRAPYAPAAPVPGGVDGQGWHAR